MTKSRKGDVKTKYKINSKLSRSLRIIHEYRKPCFPISSSIRGSDTAGNGSIGNSLSRRFRTNIADSLAVYTVNSYVDENGSVFNHISTDKTGLSYGSNEYVRLTRNPGKICRLTVTNRNGCIF